MNWCFTSGNITLNVQYFAQLLLISMCQMKCCEKQDGLTYDIGYLYFIYESESVEINTQKW